MSLSIRHVSKTYSNGVKALDRVSLQIPNGIFGLLGPNGAGKSSLMNTLATLMEPDEGEVLFNGEPIFKQPQVVRSCLGYLPQDFGVYPRVSALDLLDHLAVLKGIGGKRQRREHVAAVLAQTNLTTHGKRAVSTYSGGMRQRFGVAQALLGNPRLIIVDEPTAGLDPGERHRFQNLLSGLGRNRIVLLSTHLVSDVRGLCPRMALLSRGRVVLQGAPADLIAGIKGAIWSKRVPQEALSRCRENHQVISTRLLAGSIFVRIYSRNQPGAGFEAVVPDLEDVYFAALHADYRGPGGGSC